MFRSVLVASFKVGRENHLKVPTLESFHHFENHLTVCHSRFWSAKTSAHGRRSSNYRFPDFGWMDPFELYNLKSTCIFNTVRNKNQMWSVLLYLLVEPNVNSFAYLLIHSGTVWVSISDPHPVIVKMPKSSSLWKLCICIRITLYVI